MRAQKASPLIQLEVKFSTLQPGYPSVCLLAQARIAASPVRDMAIGLKTLAGSEKNSNKDSASLKFFRAAQPEFRKVDLYPQKNVLCDQDHPSY